MKPPVVSRPFRLETLEKRPVVYLVLLLNFSIMNQLLWKITLRISLATAGIIVLYQLSNLLLIYHYFTFEYYLLAVAIAALSAGILITLKFQKQIPDKRADNLLDGLTPKELQVLNLIAEGKSNKEIANLNFIELSTVKTHINNIYFKLGVDNRKEAVNLSLQYRFETKSTISPPPGI